MKTRKREQFRIGWLGAAAAASWFGAGSASAQLPAIDPSTAGPGRIEHCTQQIRARNFPDIFDCGDELFDTRFNTTDGVGGDVGNGQRFTRIPRYDLPGYLISPVPRGNGPDAQACVECHSAASTSGGFGDGGDGAGEASLNIIEDKVGPSGRGDPKGLVVRNPPHLFGPGGQQVLAEEMTLELQAARTAAVNQACSTNMVVTSPLRAKGVSFGTLKVTPAAQNCTDSAAIDTSGVQGIDPDLVVRSFGLEGQTASLRTFILVAFQNELGMEPMEFAGPGVDNDRDGVSDEILVDDATAMTVYLAAQPIPVTKLRLDNLRRALMNSAPGQAVLATLPTLPTLTQQQRDQIGRGDAAFREIGCARCHMPAFTLNRRTFQEPSPLPEFRQPGDKSPTGIDLIAAGVDPRQPQMFDLTMDQPDNRLQVGNQTVRFGSLQRNQQNQPVIRLFSDLKRHDMGPDNAEEVSHTSEIGQVISGRVFITAELWGVGATAPYLHDGSATTLQEAILVGHGGEASTERDAFKALPAARQADLIAFLDNQTLAFLNAEEPEVDTDGDGPATPPDGD